MAVATDEYACAVVKLAAFSLTDRFKDSEFLQLFITAGGLSSLMSVVKNSSGNTLGYALLSLQTMLELEMGAEKGKVMVVEGITEAFVKRVVEIISKWCLFRVSLLSKPDKRTIQPASEPLVHVARPATALLTLLSSPSSTLPRTIVSAIFTEIDQRPTFVKSVLERLTSPNGDLVVSKFSLELFGNLLLLSSETMEDCRFGEELEREGICKFITASFAFFVPYHPPIAF